MKAVIQRVTRAEVRVEGQATGSIGDGYVVLLGVEQGDTDADADAYAAKTAKLRLFRTETRPIDRNILDAGGAGGAALVVSQYTLGGDVRKGNRPSFVSAAEPAEAERLYDRYCEQLRSLGVPVETGRFGAMMDVELVNDGPVTIIL
jgi:D-tyrosyl-tRNA(Tyr) deacylase